MPVYPMPACHHNMNKEEEEEEVEEKNGGREAGLFPSLSLSLSGRTEEGPDEVVTGQEGEEGEGDLAMPVCLLPTCLLLACPCIIVCVYSCHLGLLPALFTCLPAYACLPL